MENIEHNSWTQFFRAAHMLREYALTMTEGKSDKITIAQEKVLMVVFSNSDGVMLKDIARELQLTPGAVSQTIDTLVRDGVLQRAASMRDRRAVIIRPTERTLRVQKANEGILREIMTQALGKVSESDRKAFTRVLGNIYEIAHTLHRQHQEEALRVKEEYVQSTTSEDKK